MKRTREEIDNAITVLQNSIGLLPDEVVLHLASYLPEAEIFRLCQTDRRFSDFCRRFDLTAERKAILELQKVTPYAELITTPQQQLNLVNRGQTTAYKINFQLGDVFSIKGIQSLTMGYIPSYENNDKYVAIRGSPPLAGTKLWIFGISKWSIDREAIEEWNLTDFPQVKALKNINNALFYDVLFEFFDDFGLNPMNQIITASSVFKTLTEFLHFRTDIDMTTEASRRALIFFYYNV